MLHAAGKILMLSLVFAPAFAQAAICFRSPPSATIEGVSGPATVSVLWNDTGEAMDEIKIDGDRVSVSSEMICGSSAPIVCRLGEGVGSVRLVFEGNRLRVVSRGLKVDKSIPASGQPRRFGLKNGPLTMVNELVQLSEEECKAAFPVRRSISIFHDVAPEKLEPKAPQISR